MKAYKSAFLVIEVCCFFDPMHLPVPGGIPCLLGYGRNSRIVAK